MIGQRSVFVIALGGLLILVLTINMYFIRIILESSSQKTQLKSLPVPLQSKIGKPGFTLRIVESNSPELHNAAFMNTAKEIQRQIGSLSPKYFMQNETYLLVLDRLMSELKIMTNIKGNIWDLPNSSWIDAYQLVPSHAPELGTILNALRKMKILQADNALVGTQLKLMLHMEHGVKAIFKPQWYSRNTQIRGPVYYGKDRHNAEVVAFHLSSLLGFRRVPLTVMRKLDLKREISLRATPKLYSTIYEKGNTTCLYGVCHYCSVDDPVCGEQNILEGALIFWLPKSFKLIKYRHPWQRVYKKNKLAAWQTDNDYCEKVKTSKIYSLRTSNRLLNLIDTAIFDFLMDNGDRHHYELAQNNFRNASILLLDNGKSFGNPNVDYLDILAPLYQCCMIHRTTWNRLTLFSGGSLSIALGKLLTYEATMANVFPLLTDAHLNAVDRRLLTIYAVIEYCLKNKKHNATVFVD